MGASGTSKISITTDTGLVKDNTSVIAFTIIPGKIFF
jgi:hypothetical protein